jgi:hypothetical protein
LKLVKQPATVWENKRLTYLKTWWIGANTSNLLLSINSFLGRSFIVGN